MKTIQLKNIITLTTLFVILFVSNPMFSQGAPDNPNNEGVESNNVNDQVPIDQNIWLGILGGCLLGVYFYAGKQKNVLSKQ